MASQDELFDFNDEQKQLQKLIDQFKLLDTTIMKVSADALAAGRNINAITLPSDLANFTAQNAQLTATIQAQARELARLQTQYTTLTQQRQRSSQRTAEESVNQGILNRNAMEAARINSTLAGAYARLSAEQNRSSRNLQDLIVRGRLATQTQREYDRELRIAQREFNELNQRVTAADRAVGRFNRNVGNYPMQAARGIRDLISAFGVVGGVQLFATIAKDIFNTTKEIQSLDLALKQVTGTQEAMARSQDFLKGISEAYGVEINGLTKLFTQFYVSAKDKLSGREIEQIFDSITKAGATMGLSTQQQERAFMALNQMMSKGTIQAEELRGQLGEALPGALGIMAKSLGVTEVQLAKMMKDGELLASEVLPKFAKQLEITYGIENVERVDNMVAAQGRLANAWTEFVRSLDDSDNKLSKIFTKTMSVLGTLVQGTTLLFESEEKKRERILDTLRKSGYDKTLQYYNSLDKLKKEDLESDKAYTSEKAKEETAEFNRLKNRNLILKAISSQEYGSDLSKNRQIVAAKEELKQNKASMNAINELLSRRKGALQALNALLEPQKESAAIVKKATDEDKKGAKAKREKTEALQSELKATGTTIQQIDKYIDFLRTEMILNSGNTEETEKLTKSLKEAEEARKAMFGGNPTASNKLTVSIDETAEAVKTLSEESKQYLKSFVDEFASNSGFAETFKMLSKDIEGFGEDAAVTFNAIAESAQEMYNFISNASQANFDAEKERLQSQYDTAFKYANGNKEAEEKLATDLEAKKKEIANREAKAKKQQAIFNIAIDTAQAIVAALKVGPPQGFILAAAAAALGAVQIAMVSSQKIPQYFKGGTHDGGLMMVNDAPGSNYKETIVYPGGSIAKPEGRNVLMNAPSGTKIYTPEQWDKIEQEKQLFNMLQPRGISMSMQNNASGFNYEAMDGIMNKYLGNVTVEKTVIDGHGFSNYVEKQGSKTKINRSFASSKGFRFS